MLLLANHLSICHGVGYLPRQQIDFVLRWQSIRAGFPPPLLGARIVIAVSIIFHIIYVFLVASAPTFNQQILHLDDRDGQEDFLFRIHERAEEGYIAPDKVPCKNGPMVALHQTMPCAIMHLLDASRHA